jgi:hypothetical protein
MHLLNSIPRGVTTKQFDIEEPSWDPLLRDCELIHMRLLYGSIRDDKWPHVYRKAFECVTRVTNNLLRF